jgi:tRNA A-37 threonylcarbamoyl transferase component Bud32
MRYLSDKALTRLRTSTELPDLGGTRYRLIAQMARGGMGVVYAAEDERLQRRVALKVLEVPGFDGDLANRLMREARVLARLEHPGIVPVHDAGTLADGRVFYAMKFVEGQRLDQHIESLASAPDRLRIFLRICDAVAFAHARGVLHRDLKPANIMVGSFGEVLVMDWGLAKLLVDVLKLDQLENDAAIVRSSVHPDSGTVIPASMISATTGHGSVLGTPGVSGASRRGNRVVGCAQRYLLSRSAFAISAQRETTAAFVHLARSITRGYLREGLRARTRSTLLRSGGTDGRRFTVPQRFRGRGISRKHFRKGHPFLSAAPVLRIADSGILTHACSGDRPAQALKV